MTKPVSLSDFYDALSKADWFYEMSDDHYIWRKGCVEFDHLGTIAKQSPEHKALMDAFVEHHYTGKPWGTEKKPRPERPCAVSV